MLSNRWWPRILCTGLLVTGALALSPGDTRGQSPNLGSPSWVAARRTASIAPGAQYRSGWLRRVLLGDHYRDLWATTITVPTLDLDGFAGGLAPDRCAGGRQTPSLRFDGSDGRHYVFRSLQKDATRGLPPALRGTIVADVLQDQTSALHPGGALVVDPLLEAAGVLRAPPHLVVLPDDDRLHDFDCVRPGMLGLVEERPTGGLNGGPSFAEAVEVLSTPKLLNLLQRDPRHRVDSRAFLRARLIDLLVGDWDRHQDQWRWARFDEPGGRYWWRPIPRDRDWALSRLDGVLPWLAGFYAPELVGFDDDYPDIFRLTWTGRVLDRRFLANLERAVVDSTAAALQAALTDSVIDAAVTRLPSPYAARSGAVAQALRRRRDRLHRAAAEFYALLAREVDIHASDGADLAEVERLPDGSVVVRLARWTGESREPSYYARTFRPHETREIRLHLYDGSDRGVVHGDASGPVVRIVGGGGDDELLDRARGGPTHFYDHGGHTRFVGGPGTRIDERRYQAPPIDSVSLAPARDWGSRTAPLVWLGSAPEAGIFIGTGFIRTTFGFRRHPHRSRVVMRAGYAPAAGAYRAELQVSVRGPVPAAAVGLDIRGSGLEALRFYGFGNETGAGAPEHAYRVRQQHYLLQPFLTLDLSRSVQVTSGPLLRLVRTARTPGTLIDSIRPYGAGTMAQTGWQTRFQLDTRDRPGAPSSGALVSLAGRFYPPLLDTRSAYGTLSGEAATYFSLPLPAGPTIAVRAGGSKVLGTAPFYDAAYVGGSGTIRGLSERRFTGHTALYGNVELSTKVASAPLRLPADLVLFGLIDAGRVFATGEHSGRWHTGFGGGLRLALFNDLGALTVAAAHGEGRMRFYLGSSASY